MASCGELWRVVVGPKTGQVGCGEIVVPQLGLLEFVGELWRVVASCGELWWVVASCGGAGINGVTRTRSNRIQFEPLVTTW